MKWLEGGLSINSLIFLIAICVTLINETSSYSELLLENGDLCKLREDADDAVVRLTAADSSKIVTQNKYFATWTGRFHFKCSFQVKAPADYGIYAVIQVLNFRKNESNGDCKDYVLFEQATNNLIDKIFSPNKPKNKKSFCGRIYASRTALELEELQPNGPDFSDRLSSNSFKTKSNSIIVTIYVGTERLLGPEKLDIKIVFTAFKQDCNPRYRDDIIQCNYCEWISKSYLLDKIQNCPYITCNDEDRCRTLDPPYGIDIMSSGTGTKVTVGAVVTILLFFLMFATCLWVCRKSQRCCWTPPSSNLSRMEMNRTRQRNAYEENGTPYGEVPAGPASPSAPPLPDVKDLPPSYDSLFPAK